MSNQAITYLVAATCGVFGLAVFVAYVVVPAWTSYSRVWQRIAASFMTLYVLAAFMLIGVGAAAGVVYFWDRIAGG